MTAMVPKGPRLCPLNVTIEKYRGQKVAVAETADLFARLSMAGQPTLIVNTYINNNSCPFSG